jgi:hypothetical protein
MSVVKNRSSKAGAELWDHIESIASQVRQKEVIVPKENICVANCPRCSQTERLYGISDQEAEKIGQKVCARWGAQKEGTTYREATIAVGREAFQQVKRLLADCDAREKTARLTKGKRK